MFEAMSSHIDSRRDIDSSIGLEFCVEIDGRSRSTRLVNDDDLS